MRKLFGEIEFRPEKIANGILVAFDEGDIRQSAFAAHKPVFQLEWYEMNAKVCLPLFIFQNGIKNSQDTPGLPKISHNGGGNRFFVIKREPLQLAKVRSLMGGLEEQP